jgi:hypothetical protein
MRYAMLGAALLVLTVVGAALWMRGGEVVTLHTSDAAGAHYATDLWIADVGGDLYLRGRPDRAWVQRLRAQPRVELVRQGRTRAYEAHLVDLPAVVAAVESAMAAKYGAANMLAETVFDRRKHIAIRLDPVEEPEPRAAADTEQR